MKHLAISPPKNTRSLITVLLLSVLLPSLALAAPKSGTGKPGGGNDGSSSKLNPPSNLISNATSETSAQINWTDTNSSEQGYKIERRSNGSQFSKITSTAADSVSFTDTGLSSGISYEYRLQAISKPAKNSSDYSEILTVTTAVADNEIDNQAPTVTLTNPLNGSIYQTAQTVNIAASASDNVAVSKVEFFKDAVLVFTDTNAPYDFAWGIDEADNGTHSLKTKAYDSNNNSSVSTEFHVTVDIDTTLPSVSITSPVNNTTYSTAQTVTINATAADNDAVSQVQFYRNNVLINSDSSAPFSSDWSFDTADNGSYSWQAVAIDDAGNQTSSSLANFTVDISVVNNPDPSDVLVDDFAFIGPTGIRQKGRMAEFNGLKALIYADAGFNKQLYLWDEQGNESWMYLPGLDTDSLFNAEYVFTSSNELWVFSSDGSAAFNESGAPALARRYQLDGAGSLPNSATLMETQSFGNQDSAAGSFIRLQSGGLLGVWYNLNTNGLTTADSWADLGFAYRSPDGVWSTVEGIRVSALQNHYHSLTLAQHPLDGSLWAFSKGDSFSSIEAIHLSESANGLVLDWVNKDYLNHGQSMDGNNGPHFERPSLLAVPDVANNTLLLAYQNADYQLFSPGIRGAKVSIAQISADGSHEFIVFPDYVERVYGLNGLTVDSQGITIAYRPVDTQSEDFYDVYTSRYANGVWEPSQFLGTTFTGPNPDGQARVLYSKSHLFYAITQNYELHRLTQQ